MAAVAAAAGAAAAAAAAAVEVIPTRYRWISTLKPSPDAPAGDKMFLSFSVPTSLLPTTTDPVDADGDIKMETKQEQEPRVVVPAVCGVDGCTAKRKYRLVRDWERGACGMDHLHILERQSGSGPVAV